MTLAKEKNLEGVKRLKVLATNGFSREAHETLMHLKKRDSQTNFGREVSSV